MLQKLVQKAALGCMVCGKYTDTIVGFGTVSAAFCYLHIPDWVGG